METQPIERARITFWWPTSGHPVWTDPTQTGPHGAKWTYCFSVPFHKTLVLRKYRMLRALGTPPIAARWACDTECQRQYNCTTGAVWRLADGTEVPIGSRMAFFPPEPCAICGEFDHDEWDDNAHPSEDTETWEEEG